MKLFDNYKFGRLFVDIEIIEEIPETVIDRFGTQLKVVHIGQMNLKTEYSTGCSDLLNIRTETLFQTLPMKGDPDLSLNKIYRTLCARRQK